MTNKAPGSIQPVLLHNERGFALATVVVLSFLLFSLVASYFSLVVIERTSIFSAQNNLKAEAIAEAAVEEVMWEYNYGGADFTGWAGIGTTRSKSNVGFTDGSGTQIGTYDVTVENYIPPVYPAIAPLPKVIATGRYARPDGTNTSVTVRAELKPRGLFNDTILTRDRITITTRVDSYSSAVGPYGGANIGSSASVRTLLKNVSNAITNSGGPTPNIHGNASTGSGSTVSTPAKVTGTVDALTDETIDDAPDPASLAVVWSNQGAVTNSSTIYTTGYYKFDSIKQGGNKLMDISGTVVFWVTGDVEITSGEIRVPLGNRLILYAGKDIKCTGNGGFNNAGGTEYPEAITIYGHPTSATTFDLSGTNDTIAAVYAPRANVDFGGTAGFWGACVVNTIDAGCNLGIHFDTQLPSKGPTKGTKLSWMRRHP